MFKDYRIKREFTQENLSEIVGISTRHLQRIEKGEKEPSLELLRKLIKILNIEDKDIIKFIRSKV